MAIKKSDLLYLKDMLSDLEVDIEAALDMARQIYSDGGPYSKTELIIEKYVNSQFDDTMRNLNLAYTGIINSYDNIDEVIDRLEEDND